MQINKFFKELLSHVTADVENCVSDAGNNFHLKSTNHTFSYSRGIFIIDELKYLRNSEIHPLKQAHKRIYDFYKKFRCTCSQKGSENEFLLESLEQIHRTIFMLFEMNTRLCNRFTCFFYYH